MRSYQLPVGYQFVPNDVELIDVYLKKKLNNERLPCDEFHDINVYEHTPEELHGMFTAPGKNVAYCFTPRFRRNKAEKRPNRTAKNGFWKMVSRQINIYRHEDNAHVGFRSTLVYRKHMAGNKQGEKTSWIMQEYTLTTQTPLQDKQNELKMDEWVLCKIYTATKGPKSNKEVRYHPYAAGQRISSVGSSSSNVVIESPNVENASVEQLENVHNSLHMDSIPQLNIEEELGSSLNIDQLPISMVQQMNYSSDQQNSYSEYGQTQYDWSQHQQLDWGHAQMSFPHDTNYFQATENSESMSYMNYFQATENSEQMSFSQDMNCFQAAENSEQMSFPQEINIQARENQDMKDNNLHVALNSEEISFLKTIDWKQCLASR